MRATGLWVIIVSFNVYTLNIWPLVGGYLLTLGFS